MELASNEKLELLNSMKVIESSCSGGECEYVLVEDNEANRNILHRIGLTDEEIKNECYPEGKTLDISVVAWERTTANWFSRKEKKFYEKF